MSRNRKTRPSQRAGRAVMARLSESARHGRGIVYRWDLDKTYLRTDFDTFRDLVRTAFEPASHKKTVPGASALLREQKASEPESIFILSGSPQQMRRVLEAKLKLDGVAWDEFVLKPSLRQLMKGRWRFLKNQVGYKLHELLKARAEVRGAPQEFLFGDDAESDAFIYSLYADICAGTLSGEPLRDLLLALGLYPEDAYRAIRLVERLCVRDCVGRIFIHLDRMTPAELFSAYGSRVCPFYNYFQPALVLVEQDALPAASALRVGAELVVEHAFSPDALMASFLDLADRGFIGRRTAEKLEASPLASVAPRSGKVEPVLERFVLELRDRAEGLEAASPVRISELDYEQLFLRDRARARAARLRELTRRNR